MLQSIRAYAFALPVRIVTRHTDKIIEASIAVGFEKIIGFAADVAPHVLRLACFAFIGHSSH